MAFLPLVERIFDNILTTLLHFLFAIKFLAILFSILLFFVTRVIQMRHACRTFLTRPFFGGIGSRARTRRGSRARTRRTGRCHKTPPIELARVFSILSVFQNSLDHLLTTLLHILIAMNFLALLLGSLGVTFIIFQEINALRTVVLPAWASFRGRRSWSVGWSAGWIVGGSAGWVAGG